MLSRAYLEITNRCNLACSFCPGTKREARSLTPEEFHILAGKLRPHTEYLYLHVLGEPLRHPQLREILEICRELSFKVSITTNGTLLAKQQALLLDAKALYKVSVSLHSFEANRQNDLESYLQGCTAFAAEAAAQGVLVELRLWNLDGTGTHGLREQNDAILAHLHGAFPGNWETNTRGFRLTDRVFLHYDEVFDWPDAALPERGSVGTCRALRDQIAVLSDGTVVPCCLDGEGCIRLGNLFEQSLGEILSSQRTQKMLSGFRNHVYEEHLCKTCGFARRFG